MHGGCGVSCAASHRFGCAGGLLARDAARGGRGSRRGASFCVRRMRGAAARSYRAWRWHPQRGARGGDLLMVVSDVFLKRAAEAGLRVREYAPARGGSVQCTVSAEDDFLDRALARGLERYQAAGSLHLRPAGHRADPPAGHSVSPESGGVAFQQPIGYAKAAPSETMIARLVRSIRGR